MKRDTRPAKIEVLAPAGNRTSLQAAIDAGCDAVYFGITGLNMRAGAENFTPAALPKVTALCRKNNVKAYLALNTIIYENELEKAAGTVRQAASAGVDAVICWDLAVVEEACRAGLPVHISTQMSVANSASLLSLYRIFHVQRFVLARECSLAHLKKIRAAVPGDIEIETFAHGAMCVSLSGRCFLSQFRHGASANRGECLQPCRREYIITEKEHGCDFRLGSGYILSPKDLCTLPFIEKLLDAGISSLKIEGRNRSPEYVHTVTAAYRTAVDFYLENRGRRHFRKSFAALKEHLMRTVTKVYNRGFSSGFYLGRPLNEWTDGPGSRASVRKEHVGKVTKYFRRAGVAEIKVESRGFSLHDELVIQGPTTGSFFQRVDSIEIDHSKIKLAEKGSLVAVKVDRTVRRNDRVYVMLPARGTET